MLEYKCQRISVLNASPIPKLYAVWHLSPGLLQTNVQGYSLVVKIPNKALHEILLQLLYQKMLDREPSFDLRPAQSTFRNKSKNLPETHQMLTACQHEIPSLCCDTFNASFVVCKISFSRTADIGAAAHAEQAITQKFLRCTIA